MRRVKTVELAVCSYSIIRLHYICLSLCYWGLFLK